VRAACRIQYCYRRRAGRILRRFMRTVYSSAARAITRFIRRARLRRQVRRNWAWLREQRLAILETNTLLAVECHGCIPEARRLFHSCMANFWQPVMMTAGPNALATQRAQLVRIYQTHIQVLRRAFLRYSTDGVGAPERAFKISRQQFSKFAKDMGFIGPLKPSIDRLFKLCRAKMDWQLKRKNQAVLPVLPVLRTRYKDPLIGKIMGHYEGAPQIDNKSTEKLLRNCPRSLRVPIKAYLHDEAEEKTQQEAMELDGFLEMLVRAADVIYTDGTNVADDFQRLLDEYILPHAEEFKDLQSAEVNEGNASLIAEVMANYEPQFRAMFQYSAMIGSLEQRGGTFSRPDMLSVWQFLTLAKECKFSAVGISFNVCLEIFVRVNQEEIGQYMNGDIPYSVLSNAMQMDYEEFLRAYMLMLVRLHTQAKEKSKGDNVQSLYGMTQEVTLKLVRGIPMHIC